MKFILLCCGLLAALTAQAADIYKCVDDSGQPTFTDAKTRTLYKNCHLFLKGDNSLPVPQGKKERTRTPTPSDFPKVDKNTQTRRDDTRKQILQDELATEKKALEEAKQAYNEGNANPEVYRTADGKTLRNVTKFEEKMRRLQADVDTHENNVKLLQKELNGMK
jgi:hypothetical protein